MDRSYQQVAQNSGFRQVPDVAMVAGSDVNPDQQLDYFDSDDPFDGNGWVSASGTSFAAPMWASVIAMADQGRVAGGLGTLDGSTQTLPDLYQLYSPPNTVGYSTYTTYFHDTIDSAGSGGDAIPGYDTVTGMGSPFANKIASYLADANGGGGGGGGGGGTGSGGGGGGLSGLKGLGHLPITQNGGGTSSGSSGSSGSS